MPIHSVETFTCHLCGFVTADPERIKQIKLTHICPACQNGKGKKYVKTYKPGEPRPHVC